MLSLSRLIFSLLLLATPALAQTSTTPGDYPARGINPILTHMPPGWVIDGTYSTYFTDHGPAVVGLGNRLLLGDATKNNTGIDSYGPFSWVEGLIGGFVAFSQLSVGSTVGALGITGYARATDALAASGSQNNINAQGITGFGYNDDTTANGVQFPIAVGANMIGGMKAGVTNGVAIGAQMDINNGSAAVPAINPNSLTPQGGTMAELLTSGAYAFATQQVGAALVVGFGHGGGPTFNAGIVIGAGTIASTAAGTLGTFPRAIELAAGYGISWFGTGTNEPGGFFFDSSGNWHIGMGGGANIIINGSTSVNCSGSPTSSFATVNGIVTHC